MSNQLQLYQQMIIDHNRKPRNFCEMTDYTCASEGLNPLCGDHFWIYLKLDEGKKSIIEASFHGTGCAISKASASIMTSELKGRSVLEAREKFDLFQRVLKGAVDLKSKEAKDLGKLMVFSGVWKFPARVKCASLAWHAMLGAVDQKSQVTTES